MEFKINNREISENSPCLIVAEMSANHGGSLKKAKEIIDAIQRTGADAVKLQTYTADTITLDIDAPDFIIPSDNPWAKSKKFYDLYRGAHTPWEWHQELFNYAHSKGLLIFSSPFDVTALDYLENLNCPAYKVASPEITDIPLISELAKTGKPVILSTGVADKCDIDLAVKTLKDNGCFKYAILSCSSFYPAPPESINLRSMQTLRELYNCPVGLSDHTLGNDVAIAAVALGANIIEKHFIDDDSIETHDSFFSSNENDFKEMVDSIRSVEKALGSNEIHVDEYSKKNIWSRRSLYPAVDIKKGDVITINNVRSVRPYYGIHPKNYDSLLGKKAKRDIKKGERIIMEDFD